MIDFVLGSCSDGKIVIMDIGNPAPPMYTTSIKILHQYQVHCEVFLLVYYLSRETILATSDDGIYCWKGNPELIAGGKVK